MWKFGCIFSSWKGAETNLRPQRHHWDLKTVKERKHHLCLKSSPFVSFPAFIFALFHVPVPSADLILLTALKRPWIRKSQSFTSLCSLRVWVYYGSSKNCRLPHLQAPVWKMALLHSGQNYQSSSGAFNVSNIWNRKIGFAVWATGCSSSQNYYVKLGNMLLMWI